MLGDILGALGLIAGMAFLVETLVEALFGKLTSNVPKLSPYKWMIYYIAVAVGIIGAFVYKFDLIFLLAKFSESPVDKTNFGIAMTGVAIGSGASYIHQFISRFFPAKKPDPVDWAVTNGQE